jgi:hypothetical protein
MFSPDTLASSTTKTGLHDIAKIFLKVALNTKNQSIINHLYTAVNLGYRITIYSMCFIIFYSMYLVAIYIHGPRLHLFLAGKKKQQISCIHASRKSKRVIVLLTRPIMVRYVIDHALNLSK